MTATIATEELLVRWTAELNRPDSDPRTIAQLEAEAAQRGINLPDQAKALLASGGTLLAVSFNPDMHPRGHDGRFIEIGALLRVVSGDNNGQRGDVESITPDPQSPGNPTIRVKLRDGGTIDVKPADVEQAPEKARLDLAAPTPAAPEKKGGLFGRRKGREESARQDLRQALGVEVNPETGLTERQEDTVNSEARDEWNAILQAEWDAEHPDEAGGGGNFYEPAMEEVLKRRGEGRPPGPAGGLANEWDADYKKRNKGATASASTDDDADLLARWVNELSAPDPDVVVVAACEALAQQRGWDPADAYQALVAAPKLFAKIGKAFGRGFNPDLHPRGKDGKFIESGGMVRLSGAMGRGPDGRGVEINGRRGQVESIAADPDTPGRPNVTVRLINPDGSPSQQQVTVKPDNIEAAPEKARVTETFGERIDRTGGRLGQPEMPVREAFRQHFQEMNDADLENEFLTHPYRYQTQGTALMWREEIEAELANRPKGGGPEGPPPETPEARERRLAAEEVKGAPDEELARQRDVGPDVWREAVAQEQAKRAERRAQQEADRQKLLDTINTAAAQLSTTDAEARAAGLDEIMSRLRWSPVDTDRVHNHIYPPNESGRWTAERAAQHEEMWNDLLSQVEAAGVPQERDAFVLGGLPGAGKSYTLRPGQQADRFGIVAWEPGEPIPEGATHVSVNPDIVKEMLIARGLLPEGISPDLKPMEQVTFLHEESSYIGKLFSERLGDLGYNVVLDNTMDSEGGMLKRMTPLARQGYSFRGLFVDIPVDESLESAKKRYLDSAFTPIGGRFVPSSVNDPVKRKSAKGNMSKNRDAMDTLVADDWFKEWMIVDNTGISTRTPKGEVSGEGTGAGTAADRYLPGNDAALPKQGPQVPTPPEPAPTITL